MYSWHWAIGSGGACLFVIFVFEDEVEGWDGGVVADFRHCLGVVGEECWEAWFRAEVFFQPLKLLLSQGGQGCRLGWLSPNSDLYDW